MGPVTFLERAFCTYRHLWMLVYAWALRYCDEAGALAVTRGAIVEAFRLAGNGYETTDGPYAEVIDLSYRHLHIHARDQLPVEHGLPAQTVPPVDDEFLYEIAWLWSAVYEAVYVANAYGKTVADIEMTIMVTDPRPVGLDHLEQSLYSSLSLLSSLRYVWAQYKCHEPESELVCDVTAIMLKREHERGLAWKQLKRSIPGGVW